MCAQSCLHTLKNISSGASLKEAESLRISQFYVKGWGRCKFSLSFVDWKLNAGVVNPQSSVTGYPERYFHRNVWFENLRHFYSTKYSKEKDYVAFIKSTDASRKFFFFLIEFKTWININQIIQRAKKCFFPSKDLKYISQFIVYIKFEIISI